jgi:hypothetical protein
MWGNPTREREILLLCFRKVQNNNKSTFPAKENTSQHQICPTEICFVFYAKTAPLSGFFHTSFFVPTVTCTDCSVRPRNNHKKSGNRLENCAKNHLDFRAQIRTDCMDPYTMASHSKKNISAKNSQKISWESCPLSSKNVPSLLLTFLSQACSKNLSNSPPDVFTTCLAHYPMHSFII